jgi:hypothetical protein
MDDDADTALAARVCEDNSEESIYPVEGLAKLWTAPGAVGLEAEFELTGPDHVRGPAVHGCIFTLAPGTYEVTLHDGDARVIGEVELLAGETAAFAYHGEAAEPRVVAEVLDLSAPPEGSWRVHVIQLALDTVEGTLDGWVYPAGSSSPVGEPVQFITDLAFGERATELVDEGTIVFEYEPGGPPTGDLYFRGVECGAAALVHVHVVYCDTSVLDEGTPCASTYGPSWGVFSVEDEQC